MLQQIDYFDTVVARKVLFTEPLEMQMGCLVPWRLTGHIQSEDTATIQPSPLPPGSRFRSLGFGH